jgi:hypothetical protein
VRLAIDAAGIYLQGGRQPTWKPGRIPWSDVAEVVLSIRRGSMPPFPFLHIEVRLRKPLLDQRGRPQTKGRRWSGGSNTPTRSPPRSGGTPPKCA